MTEEAEPGKIRLVVENDPAQLAEKHARADDDRRRIHAARALQKLTVNLLRVIAGAGEADRLPHDLHDATVAWAEFAKSASGHLAATPGTDKITVDQLFADDEPEPQTEDQWEQWARTDPQRDYSRQREWAMRELRRSILREIAATIDGSQVQISRRESDVRRALSQLESLRDDFLGRQRQLRNVDRVFTTTRVIHSTTDTARQAKAQEEIEKLRLAKQEKMIEDLAAHQWAALQAVRSANPADFERIDAFTFEVLGSMKLLKRKSKGKSKRDWELTDLGVLALSRNPAAK